MIDKDYCRHLEVVLKVGPLSEYRGILIDIPIQNSTIGEQQEGKPWENISMNYSLKAVCSDCNSELRPSWNLK